MAKTVGKYEVIKPFRDKDTKERHVVGSIYEASSAKRAAELQDRGYLAREATREAPGGEGSTNLDAGVKPNADVAGEG